MDIHLIRERKRYSSVVRYDHYIEYDDCEGIYTKITLCGSEEELLWKYMLLKEIEASCYEGQYCSVFHILNKDAVRITIASWPSP